MHRPCLFLAAALAAISAAPLSAQQMTFGDPEVQTVVGANNALNQFFQLEIESMPPAMLAKAEGIAIFPNMIKGGFILGVNYGKGVLCVRNPDRSWSAPVLVTMGGGSLGFQAGVQAADIVLVFATPRSLQGILNGQKITLGADASIAAGPVGRQVNAGTDVRLGAEIYSYARSRGLFLGVSLGGSDLSVDNNANSMLYGRFGVTPTDVFQNRGIAIRPEVQQLVANLDSRSRPGTVPVPQLPAQQVPAQQLQAQQPVANAQQIGPPPFIQQAVPQPVSQQPVYQQPAPVQQPPLVPIRQ